MVPSFPCCPTVSVCEENPDRKTKKQKKQSQNFYVNLLSSVIYLTKWNCSQRIISYAIIDFSEFSSKSSSFSSSSE